ncbi:MAG: EAL domain-containing protein, partial [Rhizobacter sp.]|nr:EAL domain-containing protein [Rhizobacter sp.]
MMADANPPILAAPADPLDPWSVLIDAMMHAVWLVDARRLHIVAANPAAAALLGVPVADLLDKPVLELAATPEELCFWGEVADGLSDHIESETLVRRFDGSVVPVTRRVSRATKPGGPDLYVVALQDRSEQLRTQRDLDITTAELAATLESTADGILVTDLAGRIRNCNQRFATIWGVPPDLLTQRNDDALLEWMRRSVVDPAAYMRRLAALDEATMLQSSDVLQLHSGRVIERVSLPQCSRGRPIGRVYSFRDITEKIEAGAQIESLSYSDALTGLPNRRRLSDRLKVTLSQAQREMTSFALLLINLDRFKHINDTLGHAFGDRVLREVADRLKACFRQEDTLARLGGDEFVLLLQGADAASAEASAQRILDSLRQPFNQAGMRFTVTASIGIVMYPPDGLDMDELMSRADAAMHEVKRGGRAGFRFHQSRMQQREDGARSRMQLDHAMRQALATGAFRLHYQPQVDLATGVVHGAEALIRWVDPELGDVAPTEFIPVAEESGFIIAIGDWVLHEAVKQAASWHAQQLALVVSVNVSALQFQQPGFVDGVATALRDAGLPAHLLELELTESMLVHDAQEALLRLQSLAQLGVKLAIDDFGTGYSSLNYLKRLPVNRLKIDRSFVDGLPDDESDVGIVNAIIHMGQALHLQIIAEGVETEGQRRFLKKAGCNQFQGFLY